ncbi:MAG: hypothetical protein V3U87_10795 [Methylococcaceae bacterium]
MTSIQELDKILTQCCEDLVDCTTIIDDLPMEPVRENIYKIGKAIAELSELRSSIYRLKPELKPEMWDEPPSEKTYGEMYETALCT